MAHITTTATATATTTNVLSQADQYAFDCLLHWRICLQLLQAAHMLDEHAAPEIVAASGPSLLSSVKQLPLACDDWHARDYHAQLCRLDTVIHDVKSRMADDISTMALLRWELSSLLALVYGRYSSDDHNRRRDVPAAKGNTQRASKPAPSRPTSNATVHLSRCRRHRRQSCSRCAPRSIDKQPLSLLESVPVFVAWSADHFVRMNSEERRVWFDLLLSLQTQAIIEGYLCDGASVFSLEQAVSALAARPMFADLFQLDREAFDYYVASREKRMDEILNIDPHDTFCTHLSRLNDKYAEQDAMHALLAHIYPMYTMLEVPALCQHATLSLTTPHPYQRAILTSPMLDALSLVDDLYVRHQYATPLDRLHGITSYERECDSNDDMLMDTTTDA
ncbi:hypothetical protein SYNPS1DRAFT_30107 [Syncephalis pseudoplumigaleata]|uniref:Uncharacterized protein n=1 Tax=Syncephalis pseudoplumigaleata TaxID=1712513 RepID=A0A4P9YW42_9FUNG|nr:hypothetical protein SYNPS1DRAFT_30107 [Syncephalis pseudoplumigaleata]|eukprot:RKP24124.1 hypothetical protein SYNPS1DRAFT_30107 [Syncephalis pseudoplumigaleata]